MQFLMGICNYCLQIPLNPIYRPYKAEKAAIISLKQGFTTAFSIHYVSVQKYDYLFIYFFFASSSHIPQIYQDPLL